MNTPDTELEDNIKSALSSNPALRDKILALIPAKNSVVTPDTEWEKELRDEFAIKYHRGDFYDPKKDKKWDNSQLITDWWIERVSTRDTYWKERIEGVLIAMSWSEENETSEAIRVLAKIRECLVLTNEDNLK